MRSEFLPFSRPSITEQDIAAVGEVLRSGWITTGPKTAEFEQKFREYVGCPAAVALCSATAGMHVALKALNLGPGDEVVTPSMTWVSTVNLIALSGAKPVFADVDRDTLMVTPQSVEACLTERTRAVIPVHFAGAPVDLDLIRQMTEARGIALIEDAAHAVGTRYRGRHVGSQGTSIFSFHPIKNITTGEGGMITTDRSDCVPQLRRERLHGIELPASHRVGADYRHWEAVSIGWKLNLTDLAAAIGLAQLKKLPAFLARRRALDRRYRDCLAALPGVRAQVGPAGAETAAHLFPVCLEPGALRIDRDGMLKALLAEHIGVGVHFRALPLHRFFRDALGLPPQSVPIACEVSQRLFSLPLYPGMSDADQDDVIEALARLVEFYRA
jgi:UDP-4-amino-4-deoxy-L-arabinose-oxoglutarate aminotransferase